VNRRVALSLALVSLLLLSATWLRADDKRLALRVWLFRLPGTELGLDVADMDGDGKTDLVAAHMTSPTAHVLDRSISVYAQLGGKASRFSSTHARRWVVPPDACVFLAGDYDPAPGGEVLFLCPTRIAGIRANGETFEVAKVDSFFDYPESSALPVWRQTWDLDGDGLNELVVPTSTGYALFKRASKDAPLALTASLKVRVKVKFGPAFETILLNRFLSASSRLRRLSAVDMNADGRLDLIVYRQKGLAQFLQREDGTFPNDPDVEKPVATVKNAKSGKKDDAGTEAFANVRLDVDDVNGDGRADLLATRTLGELGVFETLRTQQLIFLGRKDGAWDESKPDVVLNLKGVSDDPVLIDWDGDGRRDLILSSYRMDMFTNLKRAITEDMTVTYMIFRQQAGGVFESDPSFVLSTDVPLSDLERRGGIKAMLFTADLNGDGIRDMIARRVDRLEVELGLLDDGDPAFDSDNPIGLAVGRTEPPWVADLDGDGRDELIFEPFGGNDLAARTIRVVGVAK
jgi:hypothetical protein